MQEPTADIMCVDDQPANLRLLQQMLGVHGYHVRLFPSGRAALASAEKQPPDLVLLDVNMPEMDGFTVCQRLRRFPSLVDVPVIFLSALSDPADKVRAFEAGAVDYVTKPFHVAELRARVDTHLKIRQLQRELRRHNDELEAAVEKRTHALERF